MSDEFKIHHLASQVCSSLKSAIKPDNIASNFNKNRTRYVTVQVPAQEARRFIISQSSSPHEFNDLYDELKSKNVRVLDGLVFILENVCKDEKVKKMLHAHALNIGDAGKVPIGKVKPGVRQTEKQEIGNMDLEAIQKTISESARKSRRSKAPKSSKTNLLEQGDSAVSADTLLDVKAQRMKAHANEPSTCDIRYPAIWRSRHIPDLEQYKNKPVGQIGALPTESQESELVRDLLCILSGGRATYIWMKKESTEEHRILPPEYELDPSINISLRSLTVEPLKVAAALHVLLNFSERYVLHNFGMVAHAFVAELSNYVQEIRNNIVKLESVHVSLMKEFAR
ncbi:Oidioi.mRNA.OKI2018_I69.chr1.g3590.t1.cds [Oikopleura dioica]|uniref:Oidioi.mRNA.OKI2018_I69.chr1.g3590.t1.cds n=1 Tax=Oikopleura dioica TaxID=34765 RepID=A0ABN7SUL5_OIKDI|nr:Oidioi.mRNA.OKI2018_I69.chr1.g3590.t1.cds [Oikopleura dioica]